VGVWIPLLFLFPGFLWGLLLPFPAFVGGGGGGGGGAD